MKTKKPQSPPIQKQLASFAVWPSIVCATLIAYWPALRGGLIWDDASHITRPAMQSLHGLWRIWFDLSATQQYYPLLHSTFWIEHRMWGDAVLGYHLTNVLLHAASACLVVLIVRRLTLPGAWLAGMLFALHPVCVEAVAWITEQKSALSGVFYLAAALVYLRFDQSRRRSHYFLALVLFVLALLSKTVTATLPAALLVVFWWRRGRIDLRRDVLHLAPWLVLGAAAGLFTAWVERTYIGAKGAAFALSFAARVLLAGRVIWFYAAKLLWPVDLTFTYPHWTIDTGTWWQYLFPAGVLAVAIGLAVLARKHRGPLAAFLIFVGTLFPVLGFLNVYPFRFSYVADHFQYLASLALIVPAASVLTSGLGRRSTMLVPAILLLVLGVLTWRQSGDYRDAETLYRATLARNPASWMAHTNLGVVLADTPSKLLEAIGEYRAALRLNPDDAQTHADLANALARTPGGLSEAVDQYRAALRLKPESVQTHSDLGVVLSQMPGRLPDAVAEFRAALRLNPNFAEAHHNLGVALTQMPGRMPDAIAEFQAALRIDPDYADARENLARTLAQTPGRAPEAIQTYEATLQTNPDDPEAHNNLGVALAQTPGRLSEAIAQFQAALSIRPDWADAHTNLGNALSQVPGRMPDAIAELQAALRLKPNDAEAHNDLGVALGQTGRMADAIVEFRAALRVDPNYVAAHLNLANALVQSPGHSQEAIAEYKEALRLKPDDAQAHNGLGVALAQTPGRMQDAIAEFQAALRLQPDYPEAHTNLARACPHCVAAH
ncbi:MAG TPA: tetratricopeptide repeat protein [Bryobacteraceae bacterium]|nr:tetratricopeptide repeat protein [Bryobacteraceae bacterium]